MAGWSWTGEEVLAGPAVGDRWLVGARSVADEERFRIVRTWLLGVGEGGTALVLDFAAAQEPLPSELAPGTEVDADLAFFPGAWPQRALVAEIHGPAEPMAQWHGSPTVEEALAVHARALAANPWLDRLSMVLTDVVPVDREGDRRIRDATGATVRLLLEEPGWWTLLAVSGGHPVGVAGEWQDGSLRPLTVWAGDRLVPLV